MTKKHVSWDVRTGRDGQHHVTRTEVAEWKKPDGSEVTEIKTNHIESGITREC